MDNLCSECSKSVRACVMGRAGTVQREPSVNRFSHSEAPMMHTAKRLRHVSVSLTSPLRVDQGW